MQEETEKVERSQDEPEIIHLVCHCTDMKIAACRKDVSKEPFGEAEDVDRLMLCPMCVLAWPQNAMKCPWGCSCTKGGSRCGAGIPNLPVAPV